MAISAHWYSLGLQSQFGATPVNWGSDTINAALVTATYTPNQDTDQFWTTPVTNEVANGNGYTTNGITLGTKTTSLTAGHTIQLNAANISWTTATFTCRYVVIYKSTGVAGTSPLLGYVDFGANETIASGTFSVNWAATGVLNIVAS